MYLKRARLHHLWHGRTNCPYWPKDFLAVFVHYHDPPFGPNAIVGLKCVELLDCGNCG